MGEHEIIRYICIINTMSIIEFIGVPKGYKKKIDEGQQGGAFIVFFTGRTKKIIDKKISETRKFLKTLKKYNHE